MAIEFTTYKGQKYVTHKCPETGLRWFNPNEPFRLMPSYSVEERSARRETNNARIELMINESWLKEKERQRVEKDAYKASVKAVRAKDRIAWQKKNPPPVFVITEKTEWDKQIRSVFRATVEAETPPLTIDDFKSPIENSGFQHVILEALSSGVSEEVLDLFVERLVSLRRSSEEAAEALFECFAVEPRRLLDFALIPAPKKGRVLPSIVIDKPWMKDLMKHRLFSPRNTGKGELGAFVLFQGNMELLATEEKGDFIVNRGTSEQCSVEVKSVEKRSIGVRLGAEITWSDSDLHKWLMTTSLKDTELKKYVSRDLLAKHKDTLLKAGMTIEQFVERANKDLRNILAKYDKLYVYVEDEEVFEELHPDNAHFFGISSEGRWKFTPGPNTLFQSL